MSWMTQETIERTFKSYIKGLKKLTNICPQLERSGSGYTHYLGETFRPAWGGSWKTLVPHIDVISCKTADLFDFSRPKIIEPSYWVWTGSFFEVSCAANSAYTTYNWEPARSGCDAWTDDEGVEHSARLPKPAKIRESEHCLQLRIRGPKYGLKDWSDRQKEIVSLFDGAKPAVRDSYRQSVAEANKLVARWKEALKQVAASAAMLDEGEDK